MRGKWCLWVFVHLNGSIGCCLSMELFVLFILIYGLINTEEKVVLVFDIPCYPNSFQDARKFKSKFLQGLVYLIGNLMGLALAVYKCQSMGLLPTHASDWLAFIEPPEVRQKES